MQSDVNVEQNPINALRKRLFNVEFAWGIVDSK
jgi:hypothetical protein